MKFSVLREILTYVPRYRYKVFVIAIDGEIVAHNNFPNLLRDIAVLWNLNIHIILVHGISYQLKVWAQKHQLELSNADGTGATDATTLEAAIMVANQLNHKIMQGLSSLDLPAFSSNCIIAQPVGIIKGKDYEFTGKVERIDPSIIARLGAERRSVPVLSPLGFDGEGQTYRVNSDAIAFAVAKELKASKIIFTTSQGKLRAGNQTITHLSVVEAEDFLKANASEIPDVLRSKVSYGIRACKEGINRVHFVNGTEDEALLGEIFLDEGTGMMIANDYQAIRLARKQDVPAIHSLIQRAIENEELVPRTKTQITEQLEDYYVFEVDRNIIGCVALHLYPQEKTGELACLYVNSSHENAGIGQKLMTFIEKEAQRKGMKQLFVLSTQAFTFFQQKGGFTEAKGSEILPKMRREKWEQSGRNSKVLVKKL